MYFLLETCQHPGVLRILYFVSLLFDLIFIIVPIGLILMLLIDFSKAVIAGDDDKVKKSTKIVGKRIIYAVLVFATPWIVSLFLELMSYAGITTDYLTCMNNAKSGDFTYYDALLKAEDDAMEAERQEELDTAREKIEEKLEAKEQIAQEANNNGTKYMTGSSPNNNYTSGMGTLGKRNDNKEPDPMRALIKLYDSTGNDVYNPKNFSYIKDKKTDFSLGAWPKDADVSNLSGNIKTYMNGTFIFPTTGNGYSSYNHNGIDIVNSKLGVPIYSPVDGTLSYSEWGHTSNIGGNETAYSASIKMDKPVSYTGQWIIKGVVTERTGKIGTIFLTHMVGIKNRVSSGNSIKVKQGDLIGFMGIANGCVHLHMTFYESGSDYGVYTPDIKKIYGLNNSSIKNAGN